MNIFGSHSYFKVGVAVWRASNTTVEGLLYKVASERIDDVPDLGLYLTFQRRVYVERYLVNKR